MKAKTRTIAILLLVTALLLVVVPFSSLAAGNKVYVTGTLLKLDTPPDFPPETVEVLGNGKWRGHEWSLNEDHLSDPRLSGLETMKITYILDMETGSGKMWGTTEIVNDGGSWSGRWAGGVDNLYMTWHATLLGNGAYEGLVASLDYAGAYGEYVQITGHIVETGAYR